MIKDFLALGLAVGLFFSASWVSGGTVETCTPFQAVTVGNYIVQTDYWNKGQCPGTQCVSIDDQTGSYTVTKEDFHCGTTTPLAPILILYGTAFGSTSPNSDLPAPLSALKCVNSSWSFQPTDTGGWDAAYDIWLCPDHSLRAEGFQRRRRVDDLAGLPQHQWLAI